MDTEHRLALEQAMLEDPDDPGTLLVYADWLLARGDPRGDLITLHHALDGERDPTRVKALRESEATLLEQHRDRLFPAALRHHAEHQLGWARGFIRTLRLELTGSLTDADLLREVLAHPSLRCLTELQLAFSRAGHEAVLGALAELAPQALRTLHLGREGSGGAPVQFETLEALPRLEHLVLHRGIRWTHPVHPRLHRLELVLASDVLWGGDRGGHGAEALLLLQQLDRERLPALRALRVSGIDGGDLHHALGSPRLPPLTELTLDRCAGTDALCDAVAASPLAAGLRAVTLSDTMTLTGARTLAAAHDRLRLERLDVTGNRLPNSARSVLEPMCRELAFGWQQGDAVLDLLPERNS